jgi:hypothetical protein
VLPADHGRAVFRRQHGVVTNPSIGEPSFGAPALGVAVSRRPVWTELRGEVFTLTTVGKARTDVLRDRGRDFWRRPLIRPLACATASPAFVRSEIRARSNSAKAPMIWQIRRPAGILVSIASVRLLKPAPTASRSPRQRGLRRQGERHQRERPQLARALAGPKPGDALVVWKLDRLARSLSHLFALPAALSAASCSSGFKSGADRSASRIQPITDRPVPRRPCGLPVDQHRSDLLTLTSRAMAAARSPCPTNIDNSPWTASTESPIYPHIHGQVACLQPSRPGSSAACHRCTQRHQAWPAARLRPDLRCQRGISPSEDRPRSTRASIGCRAAP